MERVTFNLALWNFPAVTMMSANARYLGRLPPRLVVGKSLSDLAATFALLNRPQLFRHYLISSPALR